MTDVLTARIVLSHGITAASVAALATAVNAWLTAAGEAKLLSIQYQFDGASHNAFILYTD